MSFQRFHAWWYQSDCSYLLRRSNDYKSIEDIAQSPPMAHAVNTTDQLSDADRDQASGIRVGPAGAIMPFHSPNSPARSLTKTGSASSLASRSPEAIRLEFGHGLDIPDNHMHFYCRRKMSRASLHSTLSSLSSGGASYTSAALDRQTAMTPIPEEKSFFEASTHRASAGYNPRGRPKSANSGSFKPSTSSDTSTKNTGSQFYRLKILLYYF